MRTGGSGELFEESKHLQVIIFEFVSEPETVFPEYF